MAFNNRAAIVLGRDPGVRSDTDGAVVFVRQVAREFEKRGCQVDIYTPLGYTGGSRMEAKAQEQKSAQSSVEGARIIRFEVPGVATPSYSKPGLEFINRIAVSLGEASYFSDRKLFNYDSVLLVHMAHTFGVVNAGLVPLERTVVCPMLLGSYYSTYMAVPQAYMDIERETISKLMHIQSPSRDEARALTGAYGANPNSVFVVPRGFDPSIFKPSGRSGVANPKSPSILCANVVRMQKNQHIFVPLALDLKKRGLEPLITLVGQNGDTHNRLYNDYATRLREMIKENGLAGNFRFVPPMPQEELGTVMQQCDIAIIPSIAETFGKSALESMASGMPTIAFKDVKAYSEFMDDGKTGLLVEREAGALAYAVERLSEDASLYSTMSAAGIGRGREFSWDNVMRVFYDNIKTRIFG